MINKKYRPLFYILIIIIFIIIFLFSIQNGEESESLSMGIVSKITDIFFKNGLNEKEVEILHICIRKFAHFVLYCIVGINCFLLLCTYSVKNSYKIVISLLIGLLYATFDEIHQTFIGGRTGRLLDISIDCLGNLFGIVIGYIIMKFLVKKNKI